jgi:hypothetical protein
VCQWKIERIICFRPFLKDRKARADGIYAGLENCHIAHGVEQDFSPAEKSFETIGFSR